MLQIVTVPEERLSYVSVLAPEDPNDGYANLGNDGSGAGAGALSIPVDMMDMTPSKHASFDFGLLPEEGRVGLSFELDSTNGQAKRASTVGQTDDVYRSVGIAF